MARLGDGGQDTMDRALITRRALVGGAAVASLIRPRPVVAQTTGVWPIFLKWDAWYDAEAEVTRRYHVQLSPQRWQFRAPWFCKVLGSDRITCEGTQADADIEIQAAAAAGIKAWSFVWYGPKASGTPADANLWKGWQLYDSSTYKSSLKWCGHIGIASLGFNPWSDTAGWQANCNYWVSHFNTSNYLKIGGRPVVTIRWHESELSPNFAGSTANVTTACNYLRSQSVAAGAGNPYIIAMGDPWGADRTSAEIMSIVTGDCISNYSPTQRPVAMPATAAQMYAEVAALWTANVATGHKVAPNACLGWDVRPQVEQPLANSSRVPWVGTSQYYVRGTNAEIAGHLQQCIDFIGANPVACSDKIMIVYAWNECAEGGTSGMPTLGDPPTGSPPTTALLTAIKPVLTAAA